MILIFASLVIGSVFVLLCSALSALLWRHIRSVFSYLDASLGSDILFLLEISGLILSFVFILLFVLPGFMAWEPVQQEESLPFWMSCMAVAISVCLCRTLFTAVKDVSRGSPDFHSRPMVAVLGFFKPRLICNDKARLLLSEEEMKSVLLHEQEHIARHDNMRQLLTRLASGLRPSFHAFDEIHEMRQRLTECAADAAAAQDEKTALNLASALVRMARNTPSNAGHDHCCLSMAVPDSDVSVISERVQRLLQHGKLQCNRGARKSLITLCFASLFVLISIAFNPHVQACCYKAFEIFISI